MATSIPTGAPAGGPTGHDRWATFSSLRYPLFRRYWFGHLALVTSSTMEYIALAWLVLELTGSPLALGLTGLSQAIPSIALTMVGGVMADRMDRRNLMALGSGIVAICFFVLGTLVIAGQVQVWHVVVVAFALGCVRTVEQAARHGLFPHLVPREQIPNAVALGSLGWQVPRPIGPAIAGLLIAAFGVGPTLCTAGAASTLAMTLFITLPSRKAERSDEQQSVLRDAIEGVDFIRRDQVYYGLMGMAFVNAAFGMSYLIILPVLARDVLEVGSEGYGFLQTGFGIGGLIGALSAAALATWAGKGRQAIVGAGCFGALLVGVGLSPWYGLTFGLLFLLGIANQFYTTTITSTLQMNLPDQLRGRVMGVWGLNWSLIPIGGAVMGAIAEYFGPPAALVVGGLVITANAASVALRLPKVRELQ